MKKRLAKGEVYWAIGLDCSVYHATDGRFGADNRLFESGNYFYQILFTQYIIGNYE